MITFDAADFYPENTVTVKKWFAETSRKICYAGPLIPSGEQATAAEQRSSQDGDSIVSFLDKNLASRGERSVIYVGTYEVLIHALLLSPRLDHLWVCVLAKGPSQGVGSPRHHHGEEDTLRTSRKFPHISRVEVEVECLQVMSHASPMPWAVMPEDMKNKIAAYGDGIVSNWVPQQQVLDHPVSFA